jgi:lipoprotein-anchoring transpeptidase ErfK/SrfK
MIAACEACRYHNRTFARMKPFRQIQFFILGLVCWLGVGAADAEAQLFKPRKMKKASTLISRQPPPVIEKRFESVINPENSSVVISLSKQRAYLMTGDEVYIDTPVSTGKRAGMTPVGSFRVMEKDLDHRSSLYGDFVDSQGRVVRSGISTKVDSAPAGTRYRGAPMKYFCRLTGGGVGMHIGILPGYPASHGCVRLPAEIAPLIYKNVKVGTPVRIES